MQLTNTICLGVAGNFAHHLEQAGELEDFKDVVTATPDAPKGIFPFYLPNGYHQLYQLELFYVLSREFGNEIPGESVLNTFDFCWAYSQLYLRLFRLLYPLLA